MCLSSVVLKIPTEHLLVSTTPLGAKIPKMGVCLLLFQEADRQFTMNLGTQFGSRSMLGKKMTEKTSFIALAISTRNRLSDIWLSCALDSRLSQYAI